MSSRRPLLSVIIRSMDRPTLDRALASVAAQTYPHIEAVVVAACGEGHRALPQRVGRFPLRLVRSDVRLPRPQAANAGLDAARGELMNLLDDDDDWLAHHAETLVRALEVTPEAGLAYSQSHLLDVNERPYAVFGKPFDPLAMFYDPLFDPPAAMFRRSLIEAGVRFDDQLGTLEDVDFWIQCSLRSRFVRVPGVTCRVRPAIGTSGTSVSTGGANLDADTVRRDGALFEAKWQETERQLAESPMGLLHRGKRLLQANDHAGARPLLERAYAQTPNDVNILNLLALARHYAGDSSGGLPLIKRALRLAPGHPGILRNHDLLTRARREPVAG